MDQLPRRLGFVDASLIVIGIVIGSGIFLLPNVIARSLPSGPAILAVWVVAGILSYCGALAYAELGAMMPDTGGQYIYLREAFGPGCAFLSGWVFLLAVIPGGMAFLAVSFSIYLDHFIHLSPLLRQIVSVAVLAALAAANYIGVKEGAWIQRIFTSLKIVGLLLLIAAAAFAPHVAGVGPSPGHPLAAVSYRGVGYALTACLMAYMGWSYVSFVAGEIKNPRRNLPRAMAIGMAAVVAIYVAANAAYLNVMTVSEIAATERVGAAVAARALGPAGASVLSAIVLLSIVGAINGNILTGARIPFAQARDGLFFSRFARVHPRFETPSFSIVALTAWTALLVVTGSYETLFAYAILSAWIVFSLGVAAVGILRRKSPAAPRPYKMWGYPYSMWAFLAVSAWYMVDAIVNQPKASLMAFAVCAAGIPFYLYWRAKSRTVSPPTPIALKPE